MSVPAVDVTSSAFKANAYAYYARLRAEAPVHAVKLPNGHVAWLVSRYDDVASLLKDPRLVKDRRNALGSRPFSRLPGMLGFLQALERNMLDLDAPDHTRLRGLVHVAFTPRLVERMRARVESLSEELLSKALAAGGMNLIGAYALLIPLTVISEVCVEYRAGYSRGVCEGPDWRNSPARGRSPSGPTLARGFDRDARLCDSATRARSDKVCR